VTRRIGGSDRSVEPVGDTRGEITIAVDFAGAGRTLTALGIGTPRPG
jgi:hypothetical protein